MLSTDVFILYFNVLVEFSQIWLPGGVGLGEKVEKDHFKGLTGSDSFGTYRLLAGRHLALLFDNI